MDVPAYLKRLVREQKDLATSVEKKQQQLHFARKRMHDINVELTELETRQRYVESEIDRLSSQDLIVTEHALLRYLERVKGINRDDLIAAILGDQDRQNSLKFAGKSGAVVVQFPEGKFPLQIQNGHIVSVGYRRGYSKNTENDENKS